ncbi:MAG: O-antigen ligase family protein, partial [Actinomycetota bacterium]|nr:O-antigen ligase family protein [Actinomycetota bacterium]
LGLILLGYLRDKDRRQAVALVIMAAGLVEVVHGLPTWIAGGRPSVALTGSFYWWNPFAAFLLAPALLSLAAVAWRARPARLLGAATFPLCAAGIVLSTSRATMACLAAGTLALVGVATFGPGRRRRLLRCAGLLAAAAAVVLALTGPPFFPARVGALGGTSARGQSQSLADNGTYRVQFWREALVVAGRNPIAGAGFHSLGTASQRGTPPTWARSNLAHNGFLQVLSDGGLLLGVPFLAVLIGSGFGLARVGRRAVRGARAAPVDPGEDDSETWLRLGVPVAAAGLLAHSAVDFDWSHPADLAMLAA